MAEVLNQYTGIQNFFRTHAPCENTPYGFQPEVMDNFVKSCGKHSCRQFHIHLDYMSCKASHTVVQILHVIGVHVCFYNFSWVLCDNVPVRSWRSPF